MKIVVLLNILLITVVFLYSGDTFIDNMWVFYAVHYLSIFAYIFYFIRKHCNNLVMIFSPILFSFLYLGLSFTLGSYFIPLRYGFDKEVYDNFITIKNLNVFTTFFFIADLVLLYYWKKISKKGIAKIPSKENISWMRFNPAVFAIFFFLFLCLNYLKPLTGLLGGFLYPFKLVTIIYLVLICIRLPKKIRFLIYGVITLIILGLHYQSKREIILVVFILLFLEAIYNNIQIRIKLKFVWIGLVTAFMAVYLILAASIMRGYGSYKVDNLLDAISYVPDYIQQPYFKHGFVENFEINPVLGNSMICMDLVEREKLALQYGGTYLKVLFIPIPRSIWAGKPEGMILKYTYTLNPEHKGRGQSLPVVHYAEGFANFYWFGIIAIVGIMVIFERMFWYILTIRNMSILNWKLIFSIYVICILFQYIRGSGFDLFLLYCLMPIPLILLIAFLPKKEQ